MGDDEELVVGVESDTEPTSDAASASDDLA